MVHIYTKYYAAIINICLKSFKIWEWFHEYMSKVKQKKKRIQKSKCSMNAICLKYTLGTYIDSAYM